MQKQYLNTRLTKDHIDKILSNYNIKYMTMKNEIDNKINLMIKAFNQDIYSFLNKFVEIAEQKQKLKAYEHYQSELVSVREELKDKIHELTRLKREIDLLKIENNKLKNDCSYHMNHMNRLSMKNRAFSPSSRHPTYTLSSSSINRTQKILKEDKSSLYKTEIKDKESKEKRMKSPLYLSRSKTSKKINEFDFDDKIKIKKKNNNKLISHKNNISNSLYSEGKTEPNSIKNVKSFKDAIKKKNNKIVVIKKKNTNKNYDVKNNFIAKNNKVKKITKNKYEPTLKINNNKSTRNSMKINKNKKSETTNNSNQISGEKKSDDNSYSKECVSSSDEDENESNLNSEIKDENKIDAEINEMNDIEDDILSIMEQINDFKNQQKNGT